jgi:tetratricopeptide (TPR) repeat protein
MYVAAVPISIWIGSAIRPGIFRRVVAAGAIAALALVSYNQTRHWRDSIALWSRAVAIDPVNDIALYNLASALDEAGRRQEALARYEEVLRIVPDHDDARKNRDLIAAGAFEAEANRLAASGQLDDAIARYRRAIALDPARTHAQAALGMALVQAGRSAEALPHLREAIKLGTPEAAVSNALAFSLVKDGRAREACGVLEEARRRFPDDANVARNLAQLSQECDR